MATARGVTTSGAYLLSKLGEWAKASFAARLEPTGLRPRHVAVLSLLRNGSSAQLDLANAIGVTPSVVVDMVDELELLHAVRRVRDTDDRRRHSIQLTEGGRGLLARADELARQVDAELFDGLDVELQPPFLAALRQLALAHEVVTETRQGKQPGGGRRGIRTVAARPRSDRRR